MLERFVDAQNPVYDRVCAELQQGRKRSHWMWFIFPQIAGLGRSPLARKFAISSLKEAKAYLLHPILGSRLIHCTKLICDIDGLTINEILGYPDDLKFRSCMTLFAHATPDNQVFEDALLKYFEGQYDPRSLRDWKPKGGQRIRHLKWLNFLFDVADKIQSRKRKEL